MSLHEDIRIQIQSIIDGMDGCAIISPTAIAVAVQRHYIEQPICPHLEYASLEHLKQMSRRALARRYEDDGEDNSAYAGQGEMFSGCLQERYPTPHRNGDDPTYKLKEFLTADEVAWNLNSLRRSAHARLEHADAFEAWHQSRRQAA